MKFMEFDQDAVNLVLGPDLAKSYSTQEEKEVKALFAERFLTNLTHVLRTPMIGILGSVDLLEHIPMDPYQDKLVNDIRICGELLLNKIDDVLELSKLQNGLAEMERSSTDLNELLPQWTSAFRPLLDRKGLRLELDLDRALPANASLDQLKLKRVINNLFFTLMDSSHQEGIRISLRAASLPSLPPRLLITIAEFGASPPNRQGVESGAQAHSEADVGHLSLAMSLGMIVSQYLVELMAGELHTVTRPDAGISFEVSLPLETIQPAALPAGRGPGIAAALDEAFMASFQSVSILLVDDNELNQKLIGQMLTNYGFEVITASNGLEALNTLERKHFDLILMDMQMPRMDGYETTRLIRANPIQTNIPVIAITANSHSSDRDKCLACGCTSYLAKPFRSEALVREIKYLLNNEFIKDKQADIYSQQIILELLPEFLEMLEEMLNQLEAAIKAKDRASIRDISHSLKGMAGMYGFMRISELALAMEKAIAGDNFGKLTSLCQQITALAQESQSRLSQQGIV